MKRDQLKEKLLLHGVSDIDFSVDGIKHYEAMCLVHENNKWQVVYNSRGDIDLISEFDTEEEACNFMYNRFKKFRDF